MTGRQDQPQRDVVPLVNLAVADRRGELLFLGPAGVQHLAEGVEVVAGERVAQLAGQPHHALDATATCAGRAGVRLLLAQDGVCRAGRAHVQQQQALLQLGFEKRRADDRIDENALVAVELHILEAAVGADVLVLFADRLAAARDFDLARLARQAFGAHVLSFIGV